MGFERACMEKIILCGCGGHAKGIVAEIELQKMFHIVGFTDMTVSAEFMGYPVLGDDAALPDIYSKGVKKAFITFGSIGDVTARRKLYEKLKKIGFILPNILSTGCNIGKNVVFGEGIFVGKNAVVNSCSTIGDMAIINSACVIEHDCSVGAFCHIAPNTTLCGGVSVGTDSHIGAGATVIQNISICNNVIIGAGSVVVKNFTSPCIAFGNPCKEVKNDG